MIITNNLIGTGQIIMELMTLLLGVLMGARTGRILPGIFVYWSLMTFQLFVLSEVGVQLAIAQDQTCRMFPEGPEFFACAVLGGWIIGLAATAFGKLIQHAWKKLRSRSKQAQTNLV